jgi:hypothetical protein
MLYPTELRGHVAEGRGFEPRLAESKSAVLPLDDPSSVKNIILELIVIVKQDYVN